MKQCFAKLVPAPKQATMTSKEVLILISKLRKSELQKAQCGDRVVKMWEQYRVEYGNPEGR